MFPSMRRSCLTMLVVLGTTGLLSAQKDGDRPKPGRPEKEHGDRDGRGRGERKGHHRGMGEEFILAHDANKDKRVTFAELRAAERLQAISDEGLQRLFNRFDKNKDGAITPDELPSKTRLTRPGRPRDLNKDGRISFEEFRKDPRFKDADEKRIRSLFKRLDRDQDEFLTEKDLRMGRDRRPHSHFDLTKLDANKDGSVTLEEFKKSPRHRDLPADKLKERFERLDRNGDGTLTEEDRGPRPGPGPGGARPERDRKGPKPSAGRRGGRDERRER